MSFLHEPKRYNKMPKVRYLSTFDVDNMIYDIFVKIQNAKLPIRKVVGIANGGLNVSYPLANLLEIPHDSITISFYENTTKKSCPKVHFNNMNINEMTDILVVDDLLDSGSTIKYFRTSFGLTQGKDFWFACLLWNKNNEHGEVADFYSNEKPPEWVHFPWEPIKVGQVI